MSDNSKIEWTDATWNPVRGCTKVSPGGISRGIHWVIVGGESGPGARPMEAEWVCRIRSQCQKAGVPFFFKQWGGVRKSETGRRLDSKTYDEFPHEAEGSSIAETAGSGDQAYMGGPVGGVPPRGVGRRKVTAGLEAVLSARRPPQPLLQKASSGELEWAT